MPNFQNPQKIMEQYYLTSERLKELKAELELLRTAKRIEVAERLKRAKELGDLSENSEYIEAREEQGHVESRIFELEEMVKNAAIIKKSVSKDIVCIGSTVRVSKDGKESSFTIVGSNEARPESGLISNESPLGRSFLDKKAGDEVTVEAPAGTMVYKIIAIE